MNKYPILFILFVIASGRAFASTSITTPTVSGHWTTAGSPYLVYNNTRVDSGYTLVIDPGVEVIFQGSYGIDVAGMLRAKGTETMPIRFHAQDTTGWSLNTVEAGGWRGVHFLRYLSSTPDTSSFEYCVVSDMKALFYSRTLAHFCSFRNIAIKNCDFYHNKSMGSGGCILLTNETPFYGVPLAKIKCEISDCSFHENIANYGGIDSTSTPVLVNQGTVVFMNGCMPAIIKNNRFTNNSVDKLVSLVWDSAIVSSNVFNQNTQNDTAGTTGNASLVEFTFSKGLFTKNTADHNTMLFSGFVCSNYSSVDINANIFCNNACTYDKSAGYCYVAYGGSAIKLFSESPADSVYHNFVRNNIIANNYTGTFGSAIYDYGVSAQIVNNTIINNSAGGTTAQGSTIFFDMDGSAGQKTKLMVKNNIIYGNYGDLDINYQARLEINHNWLSSPLSNQVRYLNTILHVYSDTTNIVGTSAGLVAPTVTNDYAENALTADFHLLSTSACIRKGDTARAYIDSTDYAGAPRLTGGKIDIGAYQYPFPSLLAGTSMIPEKLRVYPNPSSGTLIVQTPEPKGTLIVSDVSGRMVCEKNVQQTSTLINLERMPPGSYFVSLIEDGKCTSVEAFIVK